LLVRLRAEDIEAEVLTSSYRGLGSGTFRGIPVTRFRYAPKRIEDLTHDEMAADRAGRSLRYKVMAVTYVLAGLVASFRIARRRRYDVIHVHWPIPHALFGRAAQAGHGAPVVSTFYSLELKLGGGSKLMRRLVSWAVTSPAEVVAISSATADALRSIAPVRVEVIPYSLPIPASPERVRPRGEAFRILFVGRLIERKGVHVLLRAVAQLPPGREVRVLVCGDGPEREQLERLAETLGLAGRCTFAGRVSDERLRQEYADADAFVLPAVVDARGDSEGLGVVLLEAMNSRVPVVASAVGGITDIVEDEVTGLLVPQGDERALAEALERLQRDDAFAQRLGEAGYRRLGTEFSWDAIVPRWLTLYDRVRARSRS
jgi:glycosyltransferase involved in cell wall biosynthesis